MSNKKLVIIIILIGFITYSRVLFHGFIWDDEEFILNNPLIHSIGNLALFFGGSSYGAGGSIIQSGAYYRPVILTIFSTIYTIFGPNAFFFHLFQLTFHIASTILIFFLFKRILREQVLSFFLALVFLVHPMNVEAVSFISATQEILYVFAGLLALFFIDNLFLTALFLVISFLLKETGLVFVIILPLYAGLFKKQNFLRCLLVAVFCLVGYFSLRQTNAAVEISSIGLFPIMRASIIERLLTIPSIIFFYLKTFFAPINLAIAQQWVVTSVKSRDFIIPFFASLLFFSALLSYLVKKKDKISIFFFIFTLVGLLPHLQIVPLNMTVAERWFYLPMAGMLGMIGIIAQKSKIKIQSFLPIFLIIILLLTIRSVIRTYYWRDGLTLYGNDIKIGQHTFDLENNLGVELFRKGRISQAKIHFEKSVELAPYWWVNSNNLGAVYERNGNLPIAENYYKQSIQNGDYYLAYENYVLILIKQNKLSLAREFLEKKALIKFPKNDNLIKAYIYVSGEIFLP